MNKLVLITLTIITLLRTAEAFSQTERGRWLVGAGSSVGFTSEKSTYTSSDGSTSESKYRSLQISPSVGYFLFKNLSLGLSIQFTHARSESLGYDSWSRDNKYLIAPFLAYYIGNGRLKPFFSASYGFGRGKSVVKFRSFPDDPFSNEPFDFKYTEKAFLGQGGIAFFVNDFVSIDLSAAYQAYEKNYEDWFSENGSDESELILHFGFSLFFN